MTKKQIDACVRERFGMGLYEFIKDKIERESLYDYEIAGILNVNSAYIGKLRQAFGIKRANAFPRRFERDYGPDAIKIFKEMIEDPNKLLSDVARHFGFSRQNAWLVYKKIYGCPYTEAYSKKQSARTSRHLLTRPKPKKQSALIDVKEKMGSLGISFHVKKQKRGSLIFTNGYRLVFRHASRPRIQCGKQYFYISNAKTADYDFFIGLCRSKDSTYYVIPRDAMPRAGVSLIPLAGPDKSKYARFKEAWHLISHVDTKRLAA